jgi:TrmH family RNA methyltransferase
MWNFGLRDLWIVNPRTRIDLEARMLSAHGLDVLETSHIVGGLDEAVRQCDLVVGTTSIASRSLSNIRRTTITPDEFALKVASRRGRIALVLGRESTGLQNAELELCDVLVSIPANDRYRTLNVAHAASIVFYEIFRHHGQHHKQPVASAAAKRRLLNYFDVFLEKADIPRHRRDLSKRAFRSLISRAVMTPRETTLLLGAFRRGVNTPKTKKVRRTRRARKAVTI